MLPKYTTPSMKAEAKKTAVAVAIFFFIGDVQGARCMAVYHS